MFGLQWGGGQEMRTAGISRKDSIAALDWADDNPGKAEEILGTNKSMEKYTSPEKISAMTDSELLQRINRAPDFGYDDEAAELNRRGVTWQWEKNPNGKERAVRKAVKDPSDNERHFKIVRFFRDYNKASKVMREGLTLPEAQAWCGREDTHGDGWFDGYTDMNKAMEKARTSHAIEYSLPMGGKVTIPAGTPVEPASNLPDSSPIKYWVKPWQGMDEYAESHERNYGFGVGAEDVTKTQDEFGKAMEEYYKWRTDFKRQWVSTDPWRGYQESQPKPNTNWFEVHSSWVTGDWPDSGENASSVVKGKISQFKSKIRAAGGETNIQFNRTSNVFSTAYQVFVRGIDTGHAQSIADEIFR